jgi:hypothetical protein
MNVMSDIHRSCWALSMPSRRYWPNSSAGQSHFSARSNLHRRTVVYLNQIVRREGTQEQRVEHSLASNLDLPLDRGQVDSAKQLLNTFSTSNADSAFLRRRDLFRYHGTRMSDPVFGRLQCRRENSRQLDELIGIIALFGGKHDKLNNLPNSIASVSDANKTAVQRGNEDSHWSQVDHQAFLEKFKVKEFPYRWIFNFSSIPDGEK